MLHFLHRIRVSSQRALALSLAFALAWAAATTAQAAHDPPADYYASATGLTGAALKTALYNTVKGHISISYSAAYTALDTLDEDPANTSNVILLYSGLSTPKAAKLSGSNGGTWNREHTWPQSYGFNTSNGPGTDLLHLYPADVDTNARRGNQPYDNVPGGTPDAEAPLCRTNGSSWEPRDVEKGKIARGILYMAVRYGSPDSYNLQLSDTPNSATRTMGKLSTLLAWNRQFPADEAERKRNDIVFTTYQNNRNPFIDVPELADLTYLAGATPQSAWKAIQFTATELTQPAVSGDTADPDTDGLPNLLEYVLHQSAKTADTSAPVSLALTTVNTSPWLVLTHRLNRFATDVTVTYETSPDLVTWTPATPETVTPDTSLDAATKLRVMRVPADPGPQSFVRLKATRP